MAAGNGYTPTQLRILEILSDGLPHRRTDLLASMDDTEASITTLAVHICFLRKKLLNYSQTILGHRKNRVFYYQQVRLLASAVDGKR